MSVGTSDFTIEGWLKLPATASGTYGVIDNRPASSNGAYINVWVSSNGQIGMGVNGGTLMQSGTGYFQPDQWFHFAYSRVGSLGKFFIDGKQVAIGSDSINYLGTSLKLGYGAWGSGYYYGYMDEIRLTIGNGRYNKNFEAPSAAFDDGL